MIDPGDVPGVQVFPLQRFEDDRGWFAEVARGSSLARAPAQANVSFSRRGVIRGLHYHTRGQDDLFVCLGGQARVVVLDRSSGRALSLDIGESNPAAVYVPGHHAHGFEALDDVLMLYFVTREYDATDPDEHMLAWNDPRVRHLWSTQSPILSERDASAAAP